MNDDDPNPIRYVQKATPFIFEGIQLFVYYHKEHKEFQVVETTTGLKVCDASTEEECIQNAKDILLKLGIDIVKQKILDIQKKYNIQSISKINNTEIL